MADDPFLPLFIVLYSTKADMKVVSRRQRRPPTPRDVQAALDCPLRCCRAPELAAGDPLMVLRNQMTLVRI